MNSLIYLNAVNIYFETVDKHTNNKKAIKTRLVTAEDTFKKNLWHMLTSTVEYIWKFFKALELHIYISKNTESVQQAKTSTSETELRSLFGIFNVYRRVVPRFTIPSLKCNELFRTNNPVSFNLNDNQRQSFHLRKEAICILLITGFPQLYLA